MGHQLREFPLNESEGGVPEHDSYELGMRRIHTVPDNVILPYVGSGVHPTSPFFAGLGGLVAQGIGTVDPVVYVQGYAGEYPLNLQPQLHRPEPWKY